MQGQAIGASGPSAPEAQVKERRSESAHFEGGQNRQQGSREWTGAMLITRVQVYKTQSRETSASVLRVLTLLITGRPQDIRAAVQLQTSAPMEILLICSEDVLTLTLGL